MVLKVFDVSSGAKRKTALCFATICTTAFILIWFDINFIMDYTQSRGNYIINDYSIQPNIICHTNSTILITVTSYVGHVKLRRAHRRAMPIDLLNSLNIKRIFLLARIPEKEKFITQAALTDENKIFGDILQGNFIESYRNLTHKHLMGLKWAAINCKEALFVLKVDDDTVFSINKTLELLQPYTGIDRHSFLLGNIINNTRPRRLLALKNKWQVTREEYPKNSYPPYLSGCYYVTTPEVAKRLTDEALLHPFFWIDDIFVIGILPKALNITLRDISVNYWWNHYELMQCCLQDMIKKFIRCDAIGPNGGKNNLIVEFNRALNNCDEWRNCTTRSTSKPLNLACLEFNNLRDKFSKVFDYSISSRIAIIIDSSILSFKSRFKLFLNHLMTYINIRKHMITLPFM